MRREKDIYYTRRSRNLPSFMIDALIALVPIAALSVYVHGIMPLIAILTSVLCTVVAEWAFTKNFFKEDSLFSDYSGIVTALVFVLLLPPYTPFWIVAFGAVVGIIFGKAVFKGMERNIFNPALIGYVAVMSFFPVTMVSNAVWQTAGIPSKSGDAVSKLLINEFGAIGDYSVLLLAVMGAFLIFRKRIYWQTPVSLFLTTIFGLYLMKLIGKNVYFSLGGLLVIGIFVISDIITTPYTSSGKIYFGVMTGVLAIVFWLFNIEIEAFYYAVLVLNAFVSIINEVFKPKLFGEVLNLDERLIKGGVLTILILLVAVVIGVLSIFGLIKYLICIYILGATLRLIRTNEIK